MTSSHTCYSPFDVFGEVEKHTTIKLLCALEGEHAYLLTVCTSVLLLFFAPTTLKIGLEEIEKL